MRTNLDSVCIWQDIVNVQRLLLHLIRRSAFEDEISWAHCIWRNHAEILLCLSSKTILVHVLGIQLAGFQCRFCNLGKGAPYILCILRKISRLFGCKLYRNYSRIAWHIVDISTMCHAMPGLHCAQHVFFGAERNQLHSALQCSLLLAARCLLDGLASSSSLSRNRRTDASQRLS